MILNFNVNFTTLFLVLFLLLLFLTLTYLCIEKYYNENINSLNSAINGIDSFSDIYYENPDPLAPKNVHKVMGSSHNTQILEKDFKGSANVYSPYIYYDFKNPKTTKPANIDFRENLDAKFNLEDYFSQT